MIWANLLNGSPRGSALLVFLTALSVAGWTHAETIIDKGTLYLDLNGATEFRWEAPDGTTLDQQVIGERRCELRWSDDPLPLVDISTSAGVSPGFVDYLGVYGGGNGNSGRGSPCEQINPLQDWTIALTGSLSAFEVNASEIDLQLKGSPEVVIVTSLDGAQTGTYLVRAGDAVDPADTTARNGQTAETAADPIPAEEDPTAGVIINCVNVTDSGPDSGDRDNCRVAFNASWDVMTFTVAGGDVSIGGGGDGGFTAESEFHLQQVFDGELDCDQTTITAINDQTGAFGQLRRLANVPEAGCTGTCVSIPYTLKWLGDELQFLADYLEDTNNPQTCAAFAFTVNFDAVDLLASGPGIVRPQDNGSTTPQDERAVEEGNFGDTVSSQIPLEFIQQFLETDPEYYLDTCLGTPLFALNDAPNVVPAYLAGDLVGMDFGGTLPPDMSSLVGTQYGCWLNIRLRYGVDSDEPADGVGTPEELRVEVDGYLRGDYTLRRR